MQTALSQTNPLNLDFKPTSRALQLYSRFMVIAVLCLIFVGALVTSHQAGLSVPDWPTTYGHNMFLYPYEEWKGGIFFEHGHRLLASGIGFLTIILTAWIWFAKRKSKIRWLGVAALVIVIIQGCLGGLTVLLKLPPAVSVCHGILAQSFLVLLVVISYLLSSECSLRRTGEIKGFDNKKAWNLALSAAILVYIQLIVAATMRHTFSGIAVPDFPTMAGRWLPIIDSDFLNTVNQQRADIHLAPIGYFNVIIHLLHRFLALLIFLAICQLLIVVARAAKTFDPRVLWSVGYISLVTVIQITLGIVALLTVREPYFTSFHVVTGAALLALSVLMTLRLWRI